MTTYNSRLLTPTSEQEETYAYRRVWRSIAIEYGVLFAVAVAAYVALTFTDFQPPEQTRLPLNVGIALLPLALWSVFSWQAERFVEQPRERLITVVILTVLVANAVSIPLINLLQIDEWLSLAPALNRIVGYTFTIGVIQELLKYLVVRYTVWPNYYRIRTDSVAYAAACATGYATVANLHFAFTDVPLDVMAIQVFSVTTLHFVTSLIIGYGLAETVFGRVGPVLLPFTFMLAATMVGLGITARTGLTNATLSTIVITAPRPLRGLLFAAVLVVSLSVSFAFLFANADRRDREATLPTDEI